MNGAERSIGLLNWSIETLVSWLMLRLMHAAKESTILYSGEHGAQRHQRAS